MSEIWVEQEWLSFVEACAFLGVEVKQLRAWIKDGSLLCLVNPQDHKPYVPKAFLVKHAKHAEPLDSLKGTITLLRDCGFSDEESVRWLFQENDSLGETPLQALRSGKKKAVRRIASTLAGL